MNTVQRQAGSVLIPVILVAMVIVLVVMWQAGLFGGGATNTESAGSAPVAPAEKVAPVEKVAATRPDRELTEGEKAAARVQSYRSEANAPEDPATLELAPVTDRNAAEDTEAAAIIAAATQLVMTHSPDFTACKAMSDAQKALECAAGAQTTALANAFQTHNDLRARGDAISLQRGGQIMQRVIDQLQEALKPFVKAADGS